MVCCVRGYHVYKDIWAAAIGEVLACSRELTNVTETVIVKLFLFNLVSAKIFGQKLTRRKNANYGIKLDTVFMLIAQSGRRCSYESNWPGCYNTSATQRAGKVLQYTYSGHYSIT